MVELTRPGVLMAGALLAVVPLLLHLLARRPPERAPLPTARFLRADPRTAIRFERRPTDLALLALRTALLLILAFAFALPSWSPRRSGTATLVLLDGGRGMAGAWTAAIDSARVALGRAGRAAQLVLFDTAASASRFDVAVLDSLRAAGPAARESDYAVAFRALRERAAGADSAVAVLITVPRWGAWSPGFAHVRRMAWGGGIALVQPGNGLFTTDDTDNTENTGSTSPRAMVMPQGGLLLSAALTALGYVVAARDSDGLPDANLYVVLDSARWRANADELGDRARAGATVVVSVAGPADAARGAVLFDDGTELRSALRSSAAAPPEGEHVIAAWEDGATAAAASMTGDGCIVRTNVRLQDEAIALTDAFPAAIARLARGCDASRATDEEDAADALPLDSAARAVLAGGPTRVAVQPLAATAGGGVSLTAPLLALAMIVALLETWLAYRRRS